MITKTTSETGAYEFTTLTCIPGVIEYKGANIQLLDLPGIIEGAAAGKGRGKQVIAVARTADCVIMQLEAHKSDYQRTNLTMELEAVGIRLNQVIFVHFRIFLFSREIKYLSSFETSVFSIEIEIIRFSLGVKE